MLARSTLLRASRASSLSRTFARSISVGDKFPSVDVHEAKWPPTPFNIADKIADKKVIVVGLPGAFTPTWSKDQVPGYKAARNEIRDKGIDEVLVYCVNDPAVMEAWAKDQRIAGTNITFFADTSCVLSEALDLVMDHPGPLGALGNKRSKRFALYVDNGVVKHIGLSETPDDPSGDSDNSASTAKGMLAAI